MRLKEKVVLVTGSSSGIGKAIALGFANEGANVIVNYNHRKESANEVVGDIKKLGRKSIAIKADVSKIGEVNNLVNKAWNEFGKIDVLINNAGITKKCSLLDISEKMWDDIINVNLKGTFLCSQAIARKMVENKIKGKIVNISSINSVEVEINRGPYNTSKGGVNLLTKSLAVELGRFGISVNGIILGTIAGTNIAGDFFNNEKIIKKILTKTPVGYIGRPEDVVGPALFLATDDSRYVQGELIVVDGGLSILKFGED